MAALCDIVLVEDTSTVPVCHRLRISNIKIPTIYKVIRDHGALCVELDKDGSDSRPAPIAYLHVAQGNIVKLQAAVHDIEVHPGHMGEFHPTQAIQRLFELDLYSFLYLRPDDIVKFQPNSPHRLQFRFSLQQAPVGSAIEVDSSIPVNMEHNVTEQNQSATSRTFGLEDVTARSSSIQISRSIPDQVATSTPTSTHTIMKRRNVVQETPATAERHHDVFEHMLDLHHSTLERDLPVNSNQDSTSQTPIKIEESERQTSEELVYASQPALTTRSLVPRLPDTLTNSFQLDLPYSISLVHPPFEVSNGTSSPKMNHRSNSLFARQDINVRDSMREHEIVKSSTFATQQSQDSDDIGDQDHKISGQNDRPHNTESELVFTALKSPYALNMSQSTGSVFIESNNVEQPPDIERFLEPGQKYYNQKSTTNQTRSSGDNKGLNVHRNTITNPDAMFHNESAKTSVFRKTNVESNIIFIRHQASKRKSSDDSNYSRLQPKSRKSAMHENAGDIQVDRVDASDFSSDSDDQEEEETTIRPRQTIAVVIPSSITRDSTFQFSRGEKATSSRSSSTTKLKESSRMTSVTPCKYYPLVTANSLSMMGSRSPSERLSPTIATRRTSSTSTLYAGEAPRVVFSNSKIPQMSSVMKFFTEQGGKTVEHATTPFDVLVVGRGELKKTCKFLMSIALGKCVVTDAWVEHSAKEGKFMDTYGYIPSDPKREKAWGITLREMIGNSRQHLFKGKTFLITTALRKEYGINYTEFEELAWTVGVMAVMKYSREVEVESTMIVLARERDDLDAVALLNRGTVCYSKDLLSISILRGALNLESGEFRIVPCSSADTKNRSKSRKSG